MRAARARGESRPDADLETQREVVGAFLAAARDGDLDRLMEVLDPEVVLRSDAGPDRGSLELRGAAAVARRALGYTQLGLDIPPALVNGVAGGGDLPSRATVLDRRRHELDFLTDPDQLRLVDLTLLDD